MIMDLSKVTIADIHIHSKYSRACSKDLSFENLAKWAKIKGLNLLGTGDFTHPKWLEEIKQLREENGLYYYENFPFVLSGEISLIYTKGRGRRVHLVLVAPSIEVVEKINAYLDTKGRRDYDGRPIFKIDCEEFAKQMIAISQDIELIPAHAWTPWFGIFGSKTGFNSLKEAFGEQEKHIHAIETGMSSDPEMNWKLSFLNNKAIVSFSDSHSFWPFRLGREASIFSKIESYQDLIKQIRENSIVGTIETDPAYGKYHWNGHRACNYSSKENNICPVCGDMLTIGVESRVGEIGNQKIDENKNHKFYFKILPLHELISVSISSGLASKKTWEVYNKMIERFGNEFNILLTASREELMSFDEKLADLILKNRAGKLEVKPGYDGEYGKLIVAGKEIGVEEDEPIKTAQKTLF
jgi:uncharacterized protein (TIGR00375 family)